MASQPLRVTESIRFGEEFELDLRAYELRRRGRPLKLERIPMDLLVLLAERRGELVTREQIIEKIWGKDVFVDTDGSINSAIRKIRQALRDDPEQPRFVQTVSGKGYRFIAAVEEPVAPSLPTTVPQTAGAENLLGKKISHYRVLQLLGGGGMGVVYKAEDLKLGRQVALKFLPGEVASDEKALAQLQQEARAASALDHPNICSIYQLGEHEGHPFIVMQFLEGQTLRDWIEAHASQDSKSRVAKLVELAIEIADGLATAHEKGIIHRDIKPANIFITARGKAKILDFGVAKFMDVAEISQVEHKEEATAGSGTAAVIGLHTTRSGALGTPSYSSPEQIRREKVDARADLFSLGLVLYEMATGQRAFSGQTAAAIRDAVTNQPVTPPTQLDPAIPSQLEAIIAKSLEKNPNRRYQSATELLADLHALRARLHTPVSKRRQVAALAAAGAILAVLALFAFNLAGVRERLFQRATSGEPTAQFKARRSIAVLGFKNLSGREDEAWISTALSEMLGAELASGQQLRVVSGENIARMKLDLSLPAAESYAQDTLSKIRQNLGTDLVLQGSYLALGKDSGGKVRVNLQLQDTQAGETIAVVLHDGSESDLGSLVTQSGASLRQKLGIGDISSRDANQVRSAIPANPEATALYAEGLAKLRSFDALAAQDLLMKAIAADPKHSLSFAALSDAWSQLGYDLKSQEQAKKAVDLSANLSREDQLAVEGRYREVAREWPRAVEIYRMLSEFFPDNLDYGLRLAQAQTSAGSGKEAMATIEALAKKPAPMGNDPRIDLAEATVADKLGDFRRAEAAAARAADKGRRQGARILTARALLARGSVLGVLGDNKNAVIFLKEAQGMFSAVGDQQGVARVLNNLGIIARRQSNLEEARKLLEETLEVYRRIGNKTGVTKVLNNLGNVYWDQGDMTRALDAHRQSLSSSRETGEKNSQVNSLNNIAGLLTLQGKLAEARQMYDESLRLSREIGDQDGVGLILGNIADLLTRQGELATAKKMAEEALVVDRQVGDKSFEAYALQQLGTIMVAQGDLAGGRSRYQQALAVRHELGEKGTEAETQLALAQLQLDAGDAAAAEAEARKTAVTFREEGAIDGEALSYSLQAMALLAQGKSAEARQAAAKSTEVARKALDFATRLQVEIAESYVAGISNSTKVAEAMRGLEAARERASRQGYRGLELEARLRLAQLGLRAGEADSGRVRFAQLQKDANASGFLLIARKTKAGLGSKIVKAQ
ncbi:MAG: tetratricopeptide repeat protein [Acidobacteriales bacterium]|nr:tetratricopeptide repeat protein [Terriglobales bacterium]